MRKLKHRDPRSHSYETIDYYTKLPLKPSSPYPWLGIFADRMSLYRFSRKGILCLMMFLLAATVLILIHKVTATTYREPTYVPVIVAGAFTFI